MPEKPLLRLEKKLTVENLWLYILKLLNEKTLYAYEIRNLIEKRFGFRVGNVTSYVVLYKLEKSGYVAPKWKGQRKYYLITKGGKKLLKKGVEFLAERTEILKK